MPIIASISGLPLASCLLYLLGIFGPLIVSIDYYSKNYGQAMHLKRKKRLWLIVHCLIGLSVGIGLILYALKQNIDLYFTPSQVKVTEHQALREFRVGGMVKKNTVKKDGELNVSFLVTDFKGELPVHYHGILPALFREGQGVVIEGHLDPQGQFEAHRVLAKHDEKYRPPNIPAAKEKA
jgi:cytochrome c-type biogenesis protein CcmE